MTSSALILTNFIVCIEIPFLVKWWQILGSRTDHLWHKPIAACGWLIQRLLYITCVLHFLFQVCAGGLDTTMPDDYATLIEGYLALTSTSWNIFSIA